MPVGFLLYVVNSKVVFPFCQISIICYVDSDLACLSVNVDDHCNFIFIHCYGLLIS
jgi:hypothetical protein